MKCAYLNRIEIKLVVASDRADQVVLEGLLDQGLLQGRYGRDTIKEEHTYLLRSIQLEFCIDILGLLVDKFSDLLELLTDGVDLIAGRDSGGDEIHELLFG